MNEYLIWIADDDPIFRLIFTMTVKKAKSNLKIVEFENGKLACESFQNSILNGAEMPCCMFMDVNMPIMSGWECIDEINDLCKDKARVIPQIFIMSSSINKEDEKRIAHYPFATGYLRKPISVEKFQEILGCCKTR